jgi:hypothetical protein
MALESRICDLDRHRPWRTGTLCVTDNDASLGDSLSPKRKGLYSDLQIMGSGS